MNREASEGPGRLGRGTSGAHEWHLAVSTLAQQVAQVVGVLAMFVAITILARRLTLSEFGAYGLLLSFTTYVLFVQTSIETAAVKAIAEAVDERARDQAFTIALTVYAAAGLAAGVVVAVLGTLLLPLFDIPAELHHEAQVSILAVAAITFAGWPLKTFQDVLRGSRHFVAASVADVTSFVVVGISISALALEAAPLSVIVAAGASIPLCAGLTSAIIFAAKRLPYGYRPSELTRARFRSFLSLSNYFFVIGAADFVIYSLDRTILGSFRSTAAVGLYEGPVRAHNLIRQFDGTLSVPVLPSAAGYLAQGDMQRARDLLVRGSRYTLAAVVPLVIVFMVLAKPILIVWLGDKFAGAATAMTILVAYWLVNATTGVVGGMLVAANRVRVLTLYAVLVAALNLSLSLALTPSLGLNGVVLGTAIAAVATSPWLIAVTLSTFGVSMGELAREAWLPAYLTGAVLAGALVAIRVSVPLDNALTVAAVALGALGVYWAVFYAAWLGPGERALVKNLGLAIIRR
jgi:O-antigen/teichoic acid export membrane protein